MAGKTWMTGKRFRLPQPMGRIEMVRSLLLHVILFLESYLSLVTPGTFGFRPLSLPKSLSLRNPSCLLPTLGQRNLGCDPSSQLAAVESGAL